jgi:hypothetical protein
LKHLVICFPFLAGELLLGKPTDYRFLSNGAVPVPSIDDKAELQDAIVCTHITSILYFIWYFLMLYFKYEDKIAR